MKQTRDLSRRALLRACAFGVPLGSLVAQAALAEAGSELPLVGEADPEASAVKYTEDASRAADAKPGASCLTCSAYSGARGASQGPCAIFPGKAVRAAGWCNAWTDM